MKNKTTTLLVIIGDLFAKQNEIKHPSSKDVSFNKNAERCYQSWRTSKFATAISLLLTSLLVAGITIDTGLKLNYRSLSENIIATSLIGLAVIFFSIIVYIPFRKRRTSVVKMALKWSKQRETVRYFAKRVSMSEIGIHTSVNQGDLDQIDLFLTRSAEYITKVILVIESETMDTIHPKQDRLKAELKDLEKHLGRTIYWTDIFDEAKIELGFKPRIFPQSSRINRRG